jgi:hypothetical protein
VAVLAAGVVALVDAGALVPSDTYLSELGARGEASASSFRLALYECAAGVGLVAVVLFRSSASPVRSFAARAALAVALAASGVFLALTASVPCSPGCPLPPYGEPNPTDWVHVVVAAGAFASCSLAMAIVARAGTGRLLRVFSSGTACVVGGAAAAGALAALVDLPGATGSVLQRVAVLAGLVWISAVGLRLVVGGGPPAHAVAA